MAGWKEKERQGGREGKQRRNGKRRMGQRKAREKREKRSWRSWPKRRETSHSRAGWRER